MQCVLFAGFHFLQPGRTDGEALWPLTRTSAIFQIVTSRHLFHFHYFSIHCTTTLQQICKHIIGVCISRFCWPKGKAKNMGIAKKSCQGFWRQCGKRRLFGRPAFRSSLELSTLRIYPKHLWTPPRACQQAKHSLTTCPWFSSCNLGGTSQEQSWPWPCSVFKGTDPAPNILILKPEMEHYFLHSGRTQHRARRRDTGPGVTWPSRIGTTRLATRLHPGFRWTSCLHGTIRSWSLVIHMISTLTNCQGFSSTQTLEFRLRSSRLAALAGLAGSGWLFHLHLKYQSLLINRCSSWLWFTFQGNKQPNKPRYSANSPHPPWK